MKTLDLHASADMLHMHPSTVLAKARAGEIPAAKPGLLLRIYELLLTATREEIDAMARSLAEIE
ncbi:hypothetical protein [Methylomonas sp. CM2]|uniref:hypothetical protein n=1 Tax=Methylomonas sp. CM2 TaxID=3417647 RepID=UPI003CFA4EAC